MEAGLEFSFGLGGHLGELRERPVGSLGVAEQLEDTMNQGGPVAVVLPHEVLDGQEAITNRSTLTRSAQSS